MQSGSGEAVHGCQQAVGGADQVSASIVPSPLGPSRNYQ
jgi:hypothetical protein